MAVAELPVVRELDYDEVIEMVAERIYAGTATVEAAESVLSEFTLTDEATDRFIHRGVLSVVGGLRQDRNGLGLPGKMAAAKAKAGASGHTLDLYYGLDRRYVTADGIEKALADFTYQDWKYLRGKYVELARGHLSKAKASKIALDTLKAGNAETARNLTKEKYGELEKAVDQLWTA